MRILQWLLVLVLLFALACWGTLAWLESPAGAAALSHWLTRQVHASAPGTEVAVEEPRLIGPLEIELDKVVWRLKSGDEILRAGQVVVAARPSGAWRAEGQVERLDLARMDQAVGKGKWSSSGIMTGAIQLAGRGRQVEEVNVSLRALPPGGNLSGELMRGLVGMMPAGAARDALLTALASQALFNFKTGEVEVVTEPERYILRLQVDGDHRLDLTIRVPKESVQFLKEMFL